MGEVGAFGRDGRDNGRAVQKDSRANWIMNLVLIGRGAQVRLPDSLVSVAVMKTAEAASGPRRVHLEYLSVTAIVAAKAEIAAFKRLQSGRSVGSSLVFGSSAPGGVLPLSRDEMDIAICFHRERGNK